MIILQMNRSTTNVFEAVKKTRRCVASGIKTLDCAWCFSVNPIKNTAARCFKITPKIVINLFHTKNRLENITPQTPVLGWMGKK